MATYRYDDYVILPSNDININLYKKRKLEEVSHSKFVKTRGYYKKFVFPTVLCELIKKTQCAYCTRTEMDLSIFFDPLCNKCIRNGVMSV